MGFEGEYIIKCIEPASGVQLRDIHKEILNKHCIIDICEVNNPAYFRVVDEDGMRRGFRRIRTSPVVSVSSDNYKSSVCLKTVNTTYTFTKVFPKTEV